MKEQPSWGEDLGRIGLMWMLAMAVATVWVLLDQRVPAWDQAEHLSFSMNFWWWLTHHNPFADGDWRSLWQLSPKYPPVFYLATAAVHSIAGPGPDQAMAANGFFALVLLLSTYGLGRHLFNARVGLMAAGLCLLMPRLVTIGLDYQLDYPVTALVMLSFWCLTLWQDAEKVWRQWAWILAFGLSFGLAIMTKQSAVLFLFVPLTWVATTVLFYRRWGRLLQLISGAIVTGAVMAPWLAVNWIFQFSIFGNTNVQSAQAEGDPMLNTLAAWTYYWQDLPAAVSWPLLVVPLIGIALWFLRRLPGRSMSLDVDGTPAGRWWLLAYLVGAYLLWSAVVNKDLRYIAPYLPALAVFLGWGLDCWWRRWRWITALTLGLAAVLTIFNVFPLPLAPVAQLASPLTPGGQHLPYRGLPYPHQELIDHVAQAQPFQITTLGGLRSTAAVNQHNVSYYGKLQDYQVYGRQVGDRVSQVDKDFNTLSWFYGQGSTAAPWPPTGEGASAELARRLAQRPDFVLDRTWPLPNNSRLYLYRRQQQPVSVTVLPEAACPALPRLDRVEIAAQTPPGQPVSVTYEWIGRWSQLSSGLVLLTWEPQTPGLSSPQAEPWIHDHGLGLGTLRPKPFQTNQTLLAPAAINADDCFQIVERTATLPPEGLAPGTYRLAGRYLQSPTETPQSLELPVVTVAIAPGSPGEATPELDWVTQLRQAGQLLQQGPDLLNDVFDPIGRINLYDPVQNYTVQAEKTLIQRWQAAPEQVSYGYSLVLAQILQLKADAAIASLETLTERDAGNPYAHAYLGFVNLYAFRPRAAQAALEPALALAPDSPEIQGLSALAALFQGNLWGAWQQGRRAIALASA